MLSSKPCYFSLQELSRLNRDKTPKHVALIPDGNRRWALQRQVNHEIGHQEGGKTLMEVVKAACELNIEVLTFYLFSTENWARPHVEINALMWLLHEFLVEQCQTMVDYGIKMHTIGALDRLPGYVKSTIQETKLATDRCDQIDMVLAINYGSRDEICRAVRKIVKSHKPEELTEEMISEQFIASHLDTASWRDPELLIRTSGEMRLSNYLLWQLSYSEIYVVDVLWPNFRPHHLLEALLNFQTRQRRLGKQ